MSLDDLELNVQSIKKDRLPEILRRRTWMRFILSTIMFGSFLVSFGKVVDFWFKGSHSEEEKQEN